MIESVRAGTEVSALAGFPKIMALALENREQMHRDGLEMNSLYVPLRGRV